MRNIDGLSNILKEKELTLSSIESLTGGMFACEMTSISGASTIFKGAIVTYMSEEKIRLLDIPQQIVDTIGVVSHEVAYLMAKNGREKIDSDYCISFTGNAGPNPMENKPVGLVFIGISNRYETVVKQCHFQGNRDEIRKQCVDKGASMLIDFILKNN